MPQDVPVVLAGDFNVVPTDRDIYPSKSYAKNALVQPEPRALFRRLLDQGWVDAIRELHPDEPMYTFWDYLRNRWPRDAGLRLDHLLLSKKAAKRLVEAGVDREVRGDDWRQRSRPGLDRAERRDESEARRSAPSGAAGQAPEMRASRPLSRLRGSAGSPGCADRPAPPSTRRPRPRSSRRRCRHRRRNRRPPPPISGPASRRRCAPAPRACSWSPARSPAARRHGAARRRSAGRSARDRRRRC